MGGVRHGHGWCEAWSWVVWGMVMGGVRHGHGWCEAWSWVV